MSPQLLVGAYAAEPSLHHGWQVGAETEFYAGLRSLAGLDGLELPFFGHGLHKFDTPWFLGVLKPSWNYILTTIPGTMDCLKADPTFGIASPHPAGRDRALSFLAEARSAMQQLNRHMGRKVVMATVVHSAPRLQHPDDGAGARALQASLTELVQWDWDGAELWLEHCDAFTAGMKPAKGFLPLAVELQALAELTPTTTKTGILINWARSAIERRSADTPLEHLQAAGPRLRGAMLSGCGRHHPLYGDWEDNHAPFANREDGTSDTDLLLSDAHTRAFLQQARQAPLACWGIKFQPFPKTLSAADRLRMLTSSLDIFSRCTPHQ